MDACSTRETHYFPFDAAYVDDLRNGRTTTAEHFCGYFTQAISRSLRHRADGYIDDVRQETFVRVLSALRRPGAIQNPERFGAYVMSVARYVLQEVQRRRDWSMPGEYDSYSHTQPDPEAVASSAETQERVMRALATLGERDRKLLSLALLDEKDHDEISLELDVKRCSVAVMLYRARIRLRDAIERSVSPQSPAENQMTA